MATAPADCACAASSHASARLSAPTCAMMSSPPAAAIQASVIALRSATESFEPSPVVPHVKTDFTPCARRFAACAGTTDVSIAPDGVNAWKFAAQRPVMRKEAILGSMLTEGGEPEMRGGEGERRAPAEGSKVDCLWMAPSCGECQCPRGKRAPRRRRRAAAEPSGRAAKSGRRRRRRPRLR